MKFKCIVYCPDCYEEDYLGCFDGGEEDIGTFDTREAAELAGEKYTEKGIWKYVIREANP